MLSDGWHRIRIDIEQGSLAASEAVLLHYRLFGTSSAEPAILPLRRFLDLCRRGKFARALFPRDPRIARWMVVLRVHDALGAGASQSEIADMLVGEGRRKREWTDDSESLRSRVRRLVREARRMAEGGYRGLLQRRR